MKSTPYVEGWFRGGLHRYGTEGTTGDRCAAISGTVLRCGVCGKQAPGEDGPVSWYSSIQECMAEGHPHWYCTQRRKTGEIVCGQPEFIQQRCMKVWLWHGFAVVAAALILVVIIAA